MLGGSLGPITVGIDSGGPFNTGKMLQAAEQWPINFGFLGRGDSALPLLFLGLFSSGGSGSGKTIATVVAMTWNFFLNNWLTYRDRRLHGLAMLRGLISFYLVCSLGVVANVGVASAVHGSDHVWWVAGIAGAVVGSVWNYAASAALTWRVR